MNEKLVITTGITTWALILSGAIAVGYTVAKTNGAITGGLLVFLFAEILFLRALKR